MSIYYEGYVPEHSLDLIRLHVKDMLKYDFEWSECKKFGLELRRQYKGIDCTFKIVDEKKFQHFLLKYPNIKIWPLA